MTSLLIGPIYLTYEKVKEHRAGKKRIKNHARYEDLKREHEGDLDLQDEERMRLDQERMKTGFAIPEPGDDGRVRLSHDWESEREREYEERYYAQMRQQRTGSRAVSAASTGYKRESWHGDHRTGTGRDYEWERGRESPAPRRSLQVSHLGQELGSNDSLSDRSSRHNMSRSDIGRSREHLQPYPEEKGKEKEEEPKDMSSLFVDDILKERGLS